uniref:RWD domain-containing protein n=1 Tax=Hippocampus comes TaxID=109280 RepID=A0A3Q2Z631_HIPCM
RGRRRMSGQFFPTEATDDHTVQQENELEALASIFEKDFQDLRQKDPWKVKRPPEVHLCLRPKGLNYGQECYVTVELQVKCPPNYPDVPPELELLNVKGLSNDHLQTLQSELTKMAAARCGEVRVNTHTCANVHVFSDTCKPAPRHPGDDLRVGRPHPRIPKRAQQTSPALLPRRDAEESSQTTGETRPGGAAEERPAA